MRMFGRSDELVGSKVAVVVLDRANSPVRAGMDQGIEDEARSRNTGRRR